MGFYSAFMVASRVEVFSRSHVPGSPGLHWASDGGGFYELRDAEAVEAGTKIVLHLNAGDDAEFAEEKKVEEVIRRYSNFVAAPIFLNGTRVNSLQALWTMPAKEVSREQHEEFYKFTGHATDRPRYTIHFSLDVPAAGRLQALLYVPSAKPSMFELAASAASAGSDVAVALYTRRVLIQSRAKDVLPRWCRFLKGVIDSEDIPLNLSRELLQQSAIIRKIRSDLCPTQPSSLCLGLHGGCLGAGVCSPLLPGTWWAGRCVGSCWSRRRRTRPSWRSSTGTLGST